MMAQNQGTNYRILCHNRGIVLTAGTYDLFFNKTRLAIHALNCSPNQTYS